jgi:hypothetical protein
MNYLSINGIETIFSQFVAADPNLSQFGFGQLYNQGGEPKVKQVYPGLWAQLTTSTTQGDYEINRTFQIIIYDVPFENHNKVISDCEEYAFRLIRFLRLNSDDFYLSGNPVINPFTDKFLDDVCGVIVDLTIATNMESSNCEDPVYNFNIKTNNV